MPLIDKLPDLSEADLGQLEQNARERIDGPRGDEANKILVALGDERRRRAAATKHAQAAEAEQIRASVRDLSFRDRVGVAFRAFPPASWELDCLRALANHPRATTEQLSRAVGYSGSYMNWFGHVCRDRQAWLGPAQPGQDGRIVYSSLLVDFGQVGDGDPTATWSLKADALAALRDLGLL